LTIESTVEETNMVDQLDYALLANRACGRDEVNRTSLPQKWQEIDWQSDDNLTGFLGGVYRSSTKIVSLGGGRLWRDTARPSPHGRDVMQQGNAALTIVIAQESIAGEDAPEPDLRLRGLALLTLQTRFHGLPTEARTGRTRRASAFLALVACLLLLVGCGKVQLAWLEDVQLQEGQQLEVTRTATGKQRSELGGPKSWEQTEMSLAFAQVPAGFAKPPIWQAPYVPMLIDYAPDQRTWSLVAAFYRCETWYALGRPMPPYVAYQSVDGQPWQQVALEERLIGRPANLLTGPRSDGEPERVTIADKEQRRRSAAPLFRQVLRQWGSKEENFCKPD
jgi:hypothetical protein